MQSLESKSFYLMHKDIPVCLLEIFEDGSIGKIKRIEANSPHFPLGGAMNDSKFHDWWRDRAIPKTRHGARSALEKLGYKNTANALVDNLALSLSDCYWIKPRGSEIKWDDVSLFHNDFFDSFGELNMDGDSIENIAKKTKFSPASSQGELKKKWCIDKKSGKRYLVKGNYGASYQQSLNEVFATSIHSQLGGSYSPYSLVELVTTDGTSSLGCLNYCLANDELEMISAWEVIQTVKYKANESMYYPLREACLKLGMDESKFDDYIDYLIMTDYLLTNTDRHMNNLGIIRNPDTLEIIGFSPIYDTGNSMFYNKTFDELRKIRFEDIKCHGFLENEERQLRYVKNRNIIDLSSLDPDFSIYDKDIQEQQIRYPLIKDLFYRKLNNLKAFQEGKNIWTHSAKRK